MTKVYPYYAAALDGLGVASLPEKEFASHIETSELVRVLSRWCPPFRGYHLHYPSWRQPSPAFRLVVDALHVFVRFGSDAAIRQREIDHCDRRAEAFARAQVRSCAPSRIMVFMAPVGYSPLPGWVDERLSTN